MTFTVANPGQGRVVYPRVHSIEYNHYMTLEEQVVEGFVDIKLSENEEESNYIYF